MKVILYTTLVALLLLHNDFWFWNDARLFAGIPSGLLYHIIYCAAASVLMFALARFAWPEHLNVASDEKQP